MKHHIVLSIVPILSMLVVMGCSGESAKSAASGVTKKTVEVAKGTITGIDEGIEEGRKAAQSTDGALIVNTKDEFEKALTVEVLSIAKYTDEPNCNITLGFSNTGAAPVRVTRLSEGRIILLDKDGYVCDADQIESEVTIPANAKKRVTFSFQCDSQNAGKIRVFDTDYTISDTLKKEAVEIVPSHTPTKDQMTEETQL